MNNEQQIRYLVENWAEAVRMRDTEKIIAFHADDFLLFDVPPPLKSIGLAAYRKSWEELFYHFTKPGVFNFHELDITAGDNVAFCTATMWCEDNAGRMDYQHLDFRLTICLKKVAGTWLIVHEHHSIPSE